MKKIVLLLALACVLCSLSAQKVKETVTLIGKDQLTGFTINIDNVPMNIVEGALVDKFETQLGLKGSKKKGFRIYENQPCSVFGDARYDIYFNTSEIGKKKNPSTQIVLVVSTGNMNCITFNNDPRSARNIVLFMENLANDVEAYKVKLRIQELKSELSNLNKERQSLIKDKQKIQDKVEKTNSDIKKISDQIEKLTDEIEKLQDKFNKTHDAALREQILNSVKEKKKLQQSYNSMQKSLLNMNKELSKLATKLEDITKTIEDKTSELEKLERLDN